MGETSYEIEQHIRETRDNLRGNIQELEEKVKTAVDWRAQFQERPGTLLAVAFGGGILFSALFPARRFSHRRYMDELEHSPAYRDVQGVSNSSTGFTNGGDRRRGKAWDALRGALVAVASSKVSNFIDELVPGFKQEYNSARTQDPYAYPSGNASAGRSTWDDDRRQARFTEEG